MRASTIHGKGDIRVETVPDPRVIAPEDAIVRVEVTCVGGSDLWYYRGTRPITPGQRTGHEFVGEVVEVGSNTDLGVGDRVIAPFAASDGTCDYCTAGLQTSCRNLAIWGITPGYDGAQGEALRVPYADATLVKVPVGTDETMLPSLLALSAVLPAGHHAASSARVCRGSTVAVIGDGAVGLCGILAARRLGAERIIALGSHPSRAAVARRFGATDVVTERGEAAIDQVRELTGGVASVLECVGTELAWRTAFGIVCDGGTIGWVGTPHTNGPDLTTMLHRNITLSGGLAPARAYLPDLLDDVLAGRLDPSPVFDNIVPLTEIADAYQEMDSRHALKVLVRP